jgi:hypothetical protein
LLDEKPSLDQDQPTKNIANLPKRLLTKRKKHMNTITRSSIYLPIAAMILTAVLTVPAAAQKQVPFKGAIQGSEIDTPLGGPPPTTLSVDGSVKGIATHVGTFSLTYKLTVNLADGTATGFAQLIAANGDSIYTTILGQGVETDTPGVASITEINTITGGTGRFAGAKGSFIVERLVNLATGFTSGSFHGAITSPGAAH